MQNLQVLQDRLQGLWVVFSRCGFAVVALDIALFGLHRFGAWNHTLYVVVVQTQHLQGEKEHRLRVKAQACFTWLLFKHKEQNKKKIKKSLKQLYGRYVTE